MAKMTKSQKDYLELVERTRERRIRWWREARFGMFIHWGFTHSWADTNGS